MPLRRNQGFTLIELLTVIAIIAILAAITFAVAPRLLERAKLRALDGSFQQLENALAEYFVDNISGYPPRYGYSLGQDAAGNALPNLVPYMAQLELFDNQDLYDNFSDALGYDTHRDGQISLAEFSPVIPNQNLLNETVRASEFRNIGALYDGTNLANQLNAFEDEERRPLVYFPVNARQFEKARQYWLQNPIPDTVADPNGSRDPAIQLFWATTWRPNSADPGATEIASLSFPPPRYDAYVLISVGPSGRTGGIVPVDLPDGLQAAAAAVSSDPTTQLTYIYHVLGLRAYFLATRDIDGNGTLDFDYEARRGGEAQFVGTVNVGGNTIVTTNDMPGEFPFDQGPVIFVGGGV